MLEVGQALLNSSFLEQGVASKLVSDEVHLGVEVNLVKCFQGVCDFIVNSKGELIVALSDAYFIFELACSQAVTEVVENLGVCLIERVEQSLGVFLETEESHLVEDHIVVAT